MFTGLIEEVGIISTVSQDPAGSRITVSARQVMPRMGLGDSISVDGACMTVVDFTENDFSFEVSPESLSKTNFGTFQPGRRVNLERPLTAESRIGGHYVTGHIDGLATLISIQEAGNSWILRFEVESADLAELFIPKGSVAVLGISLTVNEVSQNGFSAAIIPHTMAHTNLSDYQVGDRVNIETDLLGKYVRRLLFQRSDLQEVTASSRDTVTPDDTTASSFPYTLEISPGVQINAPTLAPAMQALAKPIDNGLSDHKTLEREQTKEPHPRKPAVANIHTGSWFNHDL